MPTTVQNWLRQQFRNSRDVRSTTLEPDNGTISHTYRPDLAIQTWMGAQLYVYLLLTEPKVRDIKNILRQNSRDSIGTLFFITEDLVPEDGNRGRLTDWQEALKVLTGGYVYSLMLIDGLLQPVQVHFTSDSTHDEYHTWYLRDFTIENVTVRRRKFDNGIKGTWHIGDIASPEFQRRVNNERANQRFHYRTQYTRQTEFGKKRQNREAANPKSNLKAQYRILGLKPDADDTTVKAAFRRQAMNVHPDVSALPRGEAEKRMKVLLQAYEDIKHHRGWK
ncbi:MAG: DnaJ domain-containing protein [Aggregatilineales bacterium]